MLLFAPAGWRLGKGWFNWIGGIIFFLFNISYLAGIFHFYDKYKESQSIKKWLFFLKYTIIVFLISLLETVSLLSYTFLPVKLIFILKMILTMLFYPLIVMTFFTPKLIKKAKVSAFGYTVPVIILILLIIGFILMVADYGEFIHKDILIWLYFYISYPIGMIIDSLVILLSIYLLKHHKK